MPVETYGKFELLACLARGGMAEVFLARQRGEGRFERLVVIKRILPQYADDKRFIDMFLEEARIAALLDHPNVIPIYDLGRVEEARGQAVTSYFIAMPFVHGITVQNMLKEATQRQIPVPLGISAEIACQALAGLHYAHERVGLDGRPMQLVHRDVSPSNLMINEQGRTLLLDFGIASVADSAEETGSMRGKLSYMSPEQVHAAPLDCRSDLFSLAIVLYELMVGKRLFQRKNDVQVIDAIVSDPLPDPAMERPDLPPALAAMLRRALEREPARRFATAAEMSRALERAVEPAGQQELRRFVEQSFAAELEAQQERVRRARIGGGTDEDANEAPTRVDRPQSRSARPRRLRRRWLAVTVAVVLAAVLGAGGWYLLSARRPGGPALRFGVIPFLPEDVLRREWQPIRRYLEGRIHRRVEMVFTLTYGQMVDALIAGKVDFADLSAYPFILARRRDPGLHALATAVNEKTSTYEGYLVVRQGSTARSIRDLAGSRVCFVDRTSTSGYLMPRVMLRRAGFAPERFFGSVQFSGDHYRALRDLLAERCDVACVASGSFHAAKREEIPVRRLRVLASSPPLPHGVYVASSHLPRKLAGQLRRALLDLDLQREIGRPQLGQHMQITRYVPVDLTVFEELEREVHRALDHDGGTPTDGGLDIDTDG